MSTLWDVKPHTPAIDQFCEERRLSRARMASELGISAPYWSQVLNGHRTPKAWMLVKAAEILRVPVEAITIGDPQGVEPKPGRRAS